MTAELNPTTPTTHRSVTAAQSTRVRTRLVAELQEARDLESRLRHDVADGIESRRGSTNDEVDDPEGANIAFESAQSSSMLTRTSAHVAEITAALARLDAGQYGTCSTCGSPITEGRLEARPATAYCINCAA